MLDKTSVRDLLTTFDFPAFTTFLLDAGFYSEEDMELYRNGGKHFVIPVPDGCIISKSFRKRLEFKSSFVYKKTDEDGIIKEDRILFVGSTVIDLENLYQEDLDKDAELKNKAASKNEDAEGAETQTKIKRFILGRSNVQLLVQTELSCIVMKTCMTK